MKQAKHNQAGFSHTFGLVLVLGITAVAAVTIIYLMRIDVINTPDILVFKQNTNTNAKATTNATTNNSNVNK
jgi:hypothetical protein